VCLVASQIGRIVVSVASFLPRDATRSAVMRSMMSAVRLSVRDVQVGLLESRRLEYFENNFAAE